MRCRLAPLVKEAIREKYDLQDVVTEHNWTSSQNFDSPLNLRKFVHDLKNFVDTQKRPHSQSSRKAISSEVAKSPEHAAIFAEVHRLAEREVDIVLAPWLQLTVDPHHAAVDSLNSKIEKAVHGDINLRKFMQSRGWTASGFPLSIDLTKLLVDLTR